MTMKCANISVHSLDARTATMIISLYVVWPRQVLHWRLILTYFAHLFLFGTLRYAPFSTPPNWKFLKSIRRDHNSGGTIQRSHSKWHGPPHHILRTEKSHFRFITRIKRCSVFTGSRTVARTMRRQQQLEHIKLWAPTAIGTADQSEQRNVWRLKAYAKWAAPHDLRNFRLRKKKCTNFCVYFSRLFCSFQFIERYGQRRRRRRYRDGNGYPTSKLNAIVFTTSPLKQIIIIIIW